MSRYLSRFQNWVNMADKNTDCEVKSNFEANASKQRAEPHSSADADDPELDDLLDST